MKNVKVLPEQMTVICNIQAMWDKLELKHNGKDFQRLCKLTYDQLFNLQNSLIESYNDKCRDSLDN